MLLNIAIVCCIGLVVGKKCVPKNFGDGGTVCVCNKDYCDQISPVYKLPEGQFVLYTSNKVGLRFNKTFGQFEKVAKKSKNSIKIDANKSYQKIHGFGGAFTDATGINILSLEEDLQDMLLRSYFSPEGLEYSLCRVPMGGTDFSTHAYTYDDIPNDIKLDKWKLTIEDLKYKIPVIKRAQDMSKKGFKLFGSPWTAPSWMKTKNATSGIGFLKRKFYQLWADYYLKFLEAYEKEGVTFWGLTTGNEPVQGYLLRGRINSMGWTAYGQSKWISENLGPSVRNSRFKDLKLMALDDQRFFLPWLLDILFRNNETRTYIDGIAVHWYFDYLFSANLLDKTHKKYPEKFILGSEASIGENSLDRGIKLGSWSRGERYANDIIEDLNNWVTGWVDWNMALNLLGGPTYIDNNLDSPIIVNAEAKEFYKQPTYYTLGHFSKFLPIDSIRIDTIINNNNLRTTAFKKPDNGTVIIVVNLKDRDVPVTLTDNRRGEFSFFFTKRSVNTLIYW